METHSIGTHSEQIAERADRIYTVTMADGEGVPTTTLTLEDRTGS